MTSFSSPLPSERLGVPTCIGKRSRSNSVSSHTSSTSSSAGASSIFSSSHSNSGISADSLSSCSSPESEKESPLSSINASEDERPLKSLRTEQQCSAPIGMLAPQSSSTTEEDVAALNTLEKRCTLNVSSVGSSQSDGKDDSSSPPITTTGAGKSLFVDCLVDATVHVLTMIWSAPVRKSIAFLQNIHCVTSSKQETMVADMTSCQCPVGSPMQGGIPLDLFVRETLRRSRTSCSTLQAALLYCKRVGYEVVRERATREGVTLTEQERCCLEVGQRDYSSLSRSLDDATKAVLPTGIVADPILCSRRTFLASIMVSSKFLQDRTFSNRAWSKISGLNVKELGIVERRLLSAIEFDLSVVDSEWQTWTQFLKGDWKAQVSSCQCKSDNSIEVNNPAVNAISSKETTNVPIIIRKALERTTSLNVDQVVDMEIPQPRGLEMSSPNSTPSASTFCDTSSCHSTPTQEKRMSLTSTPVKGTFTHKRESSLLATALTNRMIETSNNIVKDVNTTPVQSTVNNHQPSIGGGSTNLSSTMNEMSLPFPLRKGFAVRSISSRS